ARQTFNVRPIGTGPFRVIDIDSRQVVLTRNDDFYRTRPDRARPYLDRVILRFYPDTSEALLALSRGELDGVAGLSNPDGERARTTAAGSIQKDLKAVGINVDVRTMPFGELVDSAARQRTFDALLVEIAVSGDPDPYSFFHSTEVSDPGHNFSGYSTLPIDRNLEAARRTFDEAARR